MSTPASEIHRKVQEAMQSPSIRRAWAGRLAVRARGVLADKLGIAETAPLEELLAKLEANPEVMAWAMSLPLMVRRKSAESLLEAAQIILGPGSHLVSGGVVDTVGLLLHLHSRVPRLVGLLDDYEKLAVATEQVFYALGSARLGREGIDRGDLDAALASLSERRSEARRSWVVHARETAQGRRVLIQTDAKESYKPSLRLGKAPGQSTWVLADLEDHGAVVRIRTTSEHPLLGLLEDVMSRLCGADVRYATTAPVTADERLACFLARASRSGARTFRLLSVTYVDYPEARREFDTVYAVGGRTVSDALEDEELTELLTPEGIPWITAFTFEHRRVRFECKVARPASGTVIRCTPSYAAAPIARSALMTLSALFAVHLVLADVPYPERT